MDQAARNSFITAQSEAADRVEVTLDQLLPKDSMLADAMRYACLGGGKRLRALLVLEGAKLFNAPHKAAERAAAAVECIHAYSLIHDDLPAMDDDDMRRGKPTLHKAWDEATAILAGDALQTLAFSTLTAPQLMLEPNLKLKLCHTLAEASGANGMVGGQMMDIAAERLDGKLSLEEIKELQSMKTGALISWAAEAGPLMGRKTPGAISDYAKNLGLAFQIQDDVLDVIGSPDVTGKATQKDGEAGKATFVSLMGLENAQKEARRLVDAALEAIAPYGSAGNVLRGIAQFAINRDS
ncbi:polyprenyl synthetase family protein [Paracoccaceae bacterium GXU_MW_L88]